MRNPFFPRHSSLFKGGSASRQFDQAPSMPAPAPTTANVDVQQKRRDEMKKQKKRRGLQSTIIAGREPLGGSMETDGNYLLGGGA